MLSIKPYAVQFTKDAILLLIRKDDQLAQFAKEATSIAGQVPFERMHIVLASGSFEQRKRKFDMPNSLPVVKDALCVVEGNVSSYFLELTEEGSDRLDTMVRALVGESCIDPNRKYRLVLSSIENAAQVSVDETSEQQARIATAKDIVLGGLFAA